MLPKCLTIIETLGFYLFAASLILATLWSSFWEPFGAGCTFVDPLGPLCASFGVPGLLLSDAPVYARSSYGSLWGAREVRRVVPACFLIAFEQFGGEFLRIWISTKLKCLGCQGIYQVCFSMCFYCRPRAASVRICGKEVPGNSLPIKGPGSIYDL